MGLKVGKACILTLIFLLAFSVVSSGQSGVFYTADNFERDSADVAGSIWDEVNLETGASVSITSAIQYNSSKSLQISLINSDGAELVRTLSSVKPPNLAVSLRFRADQTIVDSGATVHFCRLRDNNGTVFARFYYRTDTGWWQFDYIDDTGAWQHGAGTMQEWLVPDKWYSLNIQIETGASGRFFWSVNGREIATISDATEATGINALHLGQTGTSGPISGELYYDDIRFSEVISDIGLLDRGRISFTYDDGHLSNYDTLKPLLDEFGLRASFYIVTEYQQGGSSFAMTDAHLVELHEQGHEVQSHTHTHADLTAITPSELADELSQPITYLENLAIPVNVLSLPFGRYNDEVIQATKDAGYQLSVTTEEGYNALPNLEARWRILRVDAAMLAVPELTAMMDYAVANKLWVVFYYHAVGDGHAGDDYWVSESDMRAIFQHAVDNQYDVLPVQQILDYPATNRAPTSAASQPAGGSGGLQSFNFTWSDADGHAHLETLYALISDGISTANAVYLKYEVDENLLYLRNDIDSSWGVGAAPGSLGSLANSQVTIAMSSCTVLPDTGKGTDIVLTADFDFRANFAGSKQIYCRAIDVHGGDSGLVQQGEYTVTVGSGSASVTLAPQAAIDAGAAWTYDDDPVQRASGETVSGLPAESDITVKPVDITGWVPPNEEQLSIIKNSTAETTLTYIEKQVLRVEFSPQGVIDAGAQWSIDGGQTWHNSGTSQSLAPGDYTLQLNYPHGWSFTGWSGGVGGNQHPLDITLSADTVVTAAFASTQTGRLQIFYDPDGSGGSYQISGPPDFNSGLPLAGLSGNYDQQVPEGDYHIMATAGLNFDIHFSASGTFSSGLNQSLGLISAGDTATITAEMVYSKDAVTLEISSTEGGTTSMAGVHRREKGTAFSVTALPEESCIFTGWRGGISSRENPLTGVLSDDLSIEATFAPNTGSLTVTVEPHRAVEAGARWRAVGDQRWLRPEEVVSGFAMGHRLQIEFSDLDDYQAPPPRWITIDKPATLHTVSAVYQDVAEDETGSLLVVSPAEEEIYWRLKHERNKWHPSGTPVSLPSGTYTVFFEPRPGWLALPVEVTIEDGVEQRVSPRWYPHLISDGADFNNDGADEAMILDSSTNWWRTVRSQVLYGGAHYLPFLGDFDGDGRTRWAAWYPRRALWRATGVFKLRDFGARGDVPVPADYDGDGVTDPAVYDQEKQLWTFAPSSKWNRGDDEPVIRKARMPFEGCGLPVPADYDGDGADDFAIYVPATGTWHIWKQDSVKFGGADGDLPVPADYNGDGVDEIAIANMSKGTWRVLDGDSWSFNAKDGDIPSTMDFDGDGAANLSWYRIGKSGIWFMFGGKNIRNFGDKNSVPVSR